MEVGFSFDPEHSEQAESDALAFAYLIISNGGTIRVETRADPHSNWSMYVFTVSNLPTHVVFQLLDQARSPARG